MERGNANLSPAIRARLASGERVPLRALVAEFGAHVRPEVAYRTFERRSTDFTSMVELSREQKVQLGRTYVIAEVLSRIGAKFEGSRRSMDRTFWLPEDAIKPKVVQSSFVKLPSPAEAVEYLQGRFKDIDRNVKRQWRLDDVRAARALVRLTQAAIDAGLADDLAAPLEPMRLKAPSEPTRLVVRMNDPRQVGQ